MAAPNPPASPPAPAPPAENRVQRMIFQPWRLALMALLVSSTVLIPRLPKFLPELDGLQGYHLESADIRVNEPPRWIPHNFVNQVLEQAGLPEEMSLLDDDLAADLADAFSRHAWVAEVRSVRKSYPARVTVDLEYRVPAVMVEVKDGLYPVDADGTLLPPVDFSIADTQHLPRVTNIASLPQGPAGIHWGDPTVLGAARLAEILAASWKTLDLARIVAPRRTAADVTVDELIYELETTGGSRIIWGRAPGTGHPGELSAEQKIGRLEKYLADYGHFGEPGTPYEIDIRHWREISRRPLSTASATRSFARPR